MTHKRTQICTLGHQNAIARQSASVRDGFPRLIANENLLNSAENTTVKLPTLQAPFLLSCIVTVAFCKPFPAHVRRPVQCLALGNRCRQSFAFHRCTKGGQNVIMSTKYVFCPCHHFVCQKLTSW